MAEAAGLTVGVIGLASLFTTCIECIDYISLARNQGQDYEKFIWKLDLLKARLRAWGESLLVTQEGNENAALRDRWREEQDTVGNCLVGIKSILEDARQMDSRYGRKPLPPDQRSASSPQERRPNPFRQIETSIKAKIGLRQVNISASKMTCWAARGKKKSDSIITDLSFYMGGLEALSDRLQVSGLRQRFLEAEVQTVTNTDGNHLMNQASKQVQVLASSQDSEKGATTDTDGIKPNEHPSSRTQVPPSSQSSEKKSHGRNTDGHTYVGTNVRDRARVQNGNIDYQSQSSHFYLDTQASDDAYAVQGDMSKEAMLGFFK